MAPHLPNFTTLHYSFANVHGFEYLHPQTARQNFWLFSLGGSAQIDANFTIPDKGIHSQHSVSCRGHVRGEKQLCWHLFYLNFQNSLTKALLSWLLQVYIIYYPIPSPPSNPFDLFIIPL